MRTKIFRALLISNYLSNFGMGLFSPLFAIFVLGVTGEVYQAAYAAGLCMLLSGVCIILFGRFIDHHYSKKKMIILAYFLLAFTGLYFIFVHDLLTLYIGQIINAIGIGILYPSWKTVYAEIEDKGHEGFEWGLFDGGNEIFFALSAFIAGILIKYSNFRVIFFLLFLSNLCAALIAIGILSTQDSAMSIEDAALQEDILPA